MAAAEPTDYLAGLGLGSGQSLLGGFGSNTTFGDNSRVFMPGMGVSSKPSPFHTDKASTGPSAKGSLSAGEVLGLPLDWLSNNPSKLRDFVNKGVLNKIPGFDVGMGMPEIMDAWENLVKRSWAINQRSGNDPNKAWTPFDVMNSYGNGEGKFGTIRKGDWLYDVATGEKVKYVGPKSKTRTDKRIDLSSPEDVRAIAHGALAELLGRAPTSEELAKFKLTLNGLENANPAVQTTTENLNDMGEVVSTSTQTSGGLSAEARAQAIADETKKTKEYGEFQSSTTYANALMQMIGGG